MKTNFMKKAVMLTAVVVTLLLSSAFITKETETNLEEGTYFFVAVSGVWQKNNVAYVSKIIYYSGYENCSNQKKEVFHREAKIAFNNYLKAHYNNEFSYGSNNIAVHQFKRSAGKLGDPIFTQIQAASEMNSWAGDEESDGHKVLYTEFGFSCE